MKRCQFCNGEMSPRNQSAYCDKCSEERRRLARIHFYGCEHPRPVKMSCHEKYAGADTAPCPICGAIPPTKEKG